MEKKLTSSQKSIIDNLKKEFLSMNAVQGFKSGIIDVQGIMQNQEKSDAFNREIDLIIESNKQLMKERIHSDLQKLEGDIKRLGLKINKTNIHSGGIIIESPNTNYTMMIFYSFGNNIKKKNPYKKDEFRHIPCDIHLSVDAKFSLGDLRGYFTKEITIEELASSDEFTNKLKSLYDYHCNTKR